MAVLSLREAFSAPVVTRVISQIKTPGSRLQNWLGMGAGGPALFPVSGRNTAWDVFNRTRTLATGRAPGVGPAATAPQKVGHVSATLHRSHEKVHISDDKLFRMRRMGESWDNIDRAGQQYLAAQQSYQAQRVRNTREFMASRVLRGEFALLSDGDDWIPVDAGNGTVDIDYQVPDGNKLKLAMLGSDIIATSWADTASPIVADCYAINAAFEQLHGRPLRHVWCNSVISQNVQNNVGMKAVAGTANIVFDSLTTSPAFNPEGIQDTGFTMVFKALPWLTWHIYEAGLDIGTAGTFTKFFDNTHAVFLPEPSAEWVEMHEGSELVRENKLAPPTERVGIAAWAEPVTQPSGQELIVVDNSLPALYIPKCVAYGLVVY